MDPQTVYMIFIGTIGFVAISLYVAGTAFARINLHYNPNNRLHWMCKHGLFPFFVLKTFRRLLNRFDGDVSSFVSIVVFAVCLLLDLYTFPIQAIAFLFQLTRLKRRWRVHLIKRKLLCGHKGVTQHTEHLLCSLCPNGSYRCT